MRNVLPQLAELPLSLFRPDLRRREEIVRFLSERPALTHEEWHRRFAAERGIPLEFVRSFRNTCSKHFEYDLSAALPGDRLVEDLGMCEATWGDVEWEIWEACGGRLPPDDHARIVSLGELFQRLWSKSTETTG